MTNDDAQRFATMRDTQPAVGVPRSAPLRALLLWYSLSGQSEALIRAAGDELARDGWEVRTANIELSDPRYTGRLGRFPLRRVWPDMLSVLPAQLRGAVCRIDVPPAVSDGHYDLVLIGSPTWWGRASMPLRSFLASADARRVLAGTRFAVLVACRDKWRGNVDEVRKRGQWQGGQYLGQVHATYAGGQLASMLALTDFLAGRAPRERFFGKRLPPTNVQPEDLESARGFAADLAATARKEQW